MPSNLPPLALAFVKKSYFAAASAALIVYVVRPSTVFSSTVTFLPAFTMPLSSNVKVNLESLVPSSATAAVTRPSPRTFNLPPSAKKSLDPVLPVNATPTFFN